MRILFVKQSQSYPRSSGHDVHSYHMMSSLAALGCRVGLLTVTPVTAAAVEGLSLEWVGSFGDLAESQASAAFSGIQDRFRRYFGVNESYPTKVGALVRSRGYDAVVVAAGNGLPLLMEVRGATRVWYAADELLLHHFSLTQIGAPATWKHVWTGVVGGVYERVFRRQVDRVWMVSARDASYARWVMGAKHVDIVPLGVDSTYFAPLRIEKIPESCVFWGRLDFAPNLDAIGWFGENVWRGLRKSNPAAHWGVYGFSAGEKIKELQSKYGFELKVDLPDLREEIQKFQLVVLPFVSGAGMKNKLLEAAAMGMPILATKMAMNGITRGRPPVLLPTSMEDWTETVRRLWSDSAECEQWGAATREWVVQNYSWESMARVGLDGLLASRSRSTGGSPVGDEGA